MNPFRLAVSVKGAVTKFVKTLLLPFLEQSEV